jgi:hypothetical protein
MQSIPASVAAAVEALDLRLTRKEVSELNTIEH